MSFDHDFKNRVNSLPRNRNHHHSSGWWLRVPLLVGSLSVIGVVLATTKSNDSADLHSPAAELKSLVSQSLNIPDKLNTLQTSVEAMDTNWSSETVQAGDSASTVFSKLNIHSHLHAILQNEEAREALENIRPGEGFRAKFGNNGELDQLVYQQDKITQLIITPSEGAYEIRSIEQPVESRQVTTQVTINDSMYLDGQKAGLSDNVIMQLFNIFAFDIDFALDIRSGDSFSAIFEERYLEGEKLKDGPILAAEFTNKGKTYRAFRYTGANGKSDYYDENGRSLQKAFIRTPIKFARISSHFNPNRKHPILHSIRAHKGVDYAAPIGTPIRATGGGTVAFIGQKKGYGNTVILQHGKTYTTLYAHLKNFAKPLKKGEKVSQGQVIGYVGQTGSATGPHLHYEFRVNNVHKNPVTVKLPNTTPLPKSEMAQFEASIRQLAIQLSEKSTLFARN